MCSGDIVQFGVDVMENSRKGIYTEFKPIIKTEEIQIIGVLILGSFNLFSYSWLYCSHCKAVFTWWQRSQSQVNYIAIPIEGFQLIIFFFPVLQQEFKKKKTVVNLANKISISLINGYR